MEVSVFDEQEALKINGSSVRPIVEAVLSLEGRKTDEVAVYFVTTEEITRLHGEFLDDPTPTDCLSFPVDEEHEGPHHVLGEIFICPQTAKEYVLGTSEDPYVETTLYLVHGLLHLLGYDDIEPSDREAMRAAEKRHMTHLVSKKLLLTF